MKTRFRPRKRSRKSRKKIKKIRSRPRKRPRKKGKTFFLDHFVGQERVFFIFFFYEFSHLISWYTTTLLAVFQLIYIHISVHFQSTNCTRSTSADCSLPLETVPGAWNYLAVDMTEPTPVEFAIAVALKGILMKNKENLNCTPCPNWS